MLLKTSHFSYFSIHLVLKIFSKSSMGSQQATHTIKAAWTKQNMYNKVQNVWWGTYVSSEELILNTRWYKLRWHKTKTKKHQIKIYPTASTPKQWHQNQCATVHKHWQMTKQTKETRLQLWQRQTTWLAHVNTAHSARNEAINYSATYCSRPARQHIAQSALTKTQSPLHAGDAALCLP